MSQTNPHIDTTAAEAYERFMVPGLFLGWTERLINLAAPRPGEHVLDVACGTGIGARLAAIRTGSSGQVAGLDIDPGVIEVARRVAQSSATQVEWHCASALKMPFKDGEFDLCLCLQGVQFFPDRIAGLAEIRRVLRPSGRLVASIWGPLEFNEGHRVVVEALESQKVDACGAKRACSFANVDDIRDTAARAGFSNVDLHTEEGVSHFESIQAFIDGMTIGASTRHAVALLSDEGRARFVRDVRSMLKPFLVGVELAYPTRTNVLFARP